MGWSLLVQPAAARDPVNWAALTVPDDPPLQYKGDATYYGKGGDKQGACGYGASKANSMDLPWSTGMTMTVAINDFQFASSLSCGMCVKFRGVGTGIGTQPLPQQWQYAVVTNRCPECAPGSLDLAASGNGRWDMQWVPIPCNVGRSTFFYHAVSDLSNPYYYSFSVSNTRVPLKNVELEEDGSWSSLRRDVSNSWNANGGTYNHPLHIRLTSVLGDVVEDWIPSSKGGQGKAQFAEDKPDPTAAAAGALPLTPEYPGITSGNAGPVAVHWNAPNGTWMKTTPSFPASPGTPTRQPSSGSASAEASANSDSPPDSASIVTPGYAPNSSPSPPQSSSASSSASSKGSLADWQQCGGTYRCTGDYCADAAYTDKQCASGSCVRYDSTWWQCKPNDKGYTASSDASQTASSSDDDDASSSSPSGSSSNQDSQGGSQNWQGDSQSSSSSGSGSASASAGSGGSLAFGGDIGSVSASASNSGASATAGRKLRMLFSQ
ncbi:hypothetical protein ABBQ38_000489 [Trebouxia sp. C0009 RCD-2024]